LSAQLDVKNYIRNFTKVNLYICRYELERLVSELRTDLREKGIEHERDMETWLDRIGRYLYIFTLYTPSTDLLKAMTPSGELDQQLEELGKNLAAKIGGELSSSVDQIVENVKIAEQYYEGIEGYKAYKERLSAIHQTNKNNMPFLDESQLLLLGITYGYRIELEGAERGAQDEEMLKKYERILSQLGDNPFWNKPMTPTRIAPPETGKFVLVRAGTFQMGNTRNDSEGNYDEKPVHTVNLTYDYWIGKYEVTFDEYDAFCEATGRSKPKDEGWTRGLRPVINVTWYDAIAYCNWLSEKEGLPKAYDSAGNLINGKGKITVDILEILGYRLPTEAEWEYAARGGTLSTKNYKYAGSDSIGEVAWYSGNSELLGFQCTQVVGKKLPNSLGFYDMSGNVWEWCHDWYGEYTAVEKENPIGPKSGARRVIRGGGWGSLELFCRVAIRDYGTPAYSSGNLGFRVVRTVF